MAAEIVHVMNELGGSLCGKPVGIESCAGAGTDQGAVGTDHSNGNPHLLRHRQCVVMAASRGQHTLYARRMGSAQSRQIASGDLKMRIKQRSVNVDGDQAYGGGHYLEIVSQNCLNKIRSTLFVTLGMIGSPNCTRSLASRGNFLFAGPRIIK